ncbi:hypothetical protein T261_7023 [Streptomyces lydicus]|nr:hypothetical protein T261_7023 [Streptomyces lydicus]
MEIFRNLNQGLLEMCRGIEMLRFIEHSRKARTLPVVDIGVAVDTPRTSSARGFARNRNSPGPPPSEATDLG